MGKHLRKLGNILALLRTEKHTLKLRVLTLGTMVFGLVLVPACSEANLVSQVHNLTLNLTIGNFTVQDAP